MTNMERRTRKNLFRRIGVTAAILVISVIAVLYISFKLFERKHQLGLVPSSLKVSKIIYSEEDSHGFPIRVDEAAGVIVYELSEEIAAEIQKEGLGFFSKQDRNGHGHGKDWAETPLPLGPSWRQQFSGDQFIYTPEPRLRNYLDKRPYFEIPVDPDIDRQVIEIVSAPGAYFAWSTASRMIIVAPAARRVFIIYKG